MLVVTVGPSSGALAPALVAAGATTLRLNAAHFSVAELGTAARALRAAVPRTPLVVDLQGAKMRLGALTAREVRAGERLTLVPGERGTGAEVPVPHPELFASVRDGDTLSVDDGRLELRVLRAGSERLAVECLRAGALSPRKGVNVLEHPVVLTDLSTVDDARIAAVGAVDLVSFAVSFVATGRELSWVRRRAPGRPVVAKVERRAALENLAAIERAADEVWICRGDLGAELGLPAMARAVAALDPRRGARPMLMAGQVLEHLTHHGEPTRTEVCHLHDLLARGYAGIVLSDETAIGVDPVHATATAAALLAAFGPAVTAGRTRP